MSLRVSHLRFAHSDAAPVFEDASFHLDRAGSERRHWTGLVGPNGGGKTTLLRLLAGELGPQAGEIRYEPAAARVILCEQLAPGDPRRFVRLATSTEQRACELRGQLRLEPEQLDRWPSCSPGERKRWQIGAALLDEPDVLLLDEPTNHLDAQGRELLIGALRIFRGLGLVVSHDRPLLEALTSRTLRIDRAEVRLWPGAYEAARRQWEREEAEARETRLSAKSQLRAAERRLDDAHRRHRAAHAALSSKRRMKDAHDHDGRGALAKGRAESAERTLGRQVGVQRRRTERAEDDLAAIEVTEPLGRSLFLGYERASRPRLLSFDGTLQAADRVLCAHAHVWLERGAQVHLAGPNGAGKSTLLREMLRGSTLPADKVLYLPQELDEDETTAMLRSVRELSPIERGRVLSMVAALGVPPERLLASARPSPGEARKLAIALGLGRHAWALVLDEPTNHLDLPSVERLEEALSSFPGALLLVTHDPSLAARCTSERWEIGPDRLERT